MVSNKEGNTLRKEIKEMGWDIYFECMIGSMDAIKDKPNPEPVYMALEKMNLQKGNHIWFVGDTTVDIECAHSSGCTPILYGDKVAAPDLESLNIPHKHVECHVGLVELLTN
jgi:phosphoglycolate phosphatase